jgi:hypothetical protein
MMSTEELQRLKSIHPHELANELGIDFRPTLRGGMLPATWRSEKHHSVSYLKLAQGHWHWTDFGTGESGSHIDLIMKSQGMSYVQAIYQLQNICDHGISVKTPTSFSFSLPFSIPSKLSWDIRAIRTCSISDIKHLEVYRHLDIEMIPLGKLKWMTIAHREKKFTRQCYGIKNSSGGYEFFSGYSSAHSLSFKSCYGKKDISVVNRGIRSWTVGESLIDAMSVQQIYGGSALSLISLNGVTQVGRLEKFLAKYHLRIGKLILALDHDPPGELAQGKIIGLCKRFNIIFEVLNYTGKDPNDALKSLSVCIN